jgi:DNA mismatch repair protein mutS (fragment)
VDKYLTRIGASDDILSGQSTFMVEMSEVSNIINNATENSLIILDEVGRGTSTFDGVSIATAISEYLHERIRAKTIFATHYHELTDLENKFENIVNYRIEVKEKNGKVMFLRNIIKGGADRSYGIEVAKLAGLPKEILKESRKILHRLEQRKELIEKTINIKQLSLFGQIAEIDSKYEEDLDVVENERNEIKDEVIFDIENKDINNITPMEALKFLSEIKAKLEEKN